MNAFRAIYRFWISLMAIAVVVQIGFAGYGAFDTADKVDGGTVNQHSFEDSFGPHAALGYFIFLGSLVLLLLSFGARGKQRILRSVGVVVLLVIQILLAWNGASAPYIVGALHPINAFIILGFLGSIAFREWKGERMGMGQAPPGA